MLDLIITVHDEAIVGEIHAYTQDNVLAGRITYVKNDAHHITIEHTYVEEAFNGQGVGGQLVKAAIEYCEANNIKITPVCPYVVHYFEKHADEVASVLYK